MKRKRILLIGGVLIAVSLIALTLMSGIFIKPFLEYAIRDNGFPKANIESVTVIPNGLLLEMVYLDADGFSTIDAVQITGSWIDLIFRKKISALTFKNAALSGEINDQGQYVIAGWDGSLLHEDSSGGLTIDNINMTGLTVDFETPEGAIRTEGKLTLQAAQDGSRDFQANLWGKQKQLSLMVTATGKILPTGQWSSSVEINDGRLDMGGFKASRSSGWITLKGGAGAPISYAGQFSAGGLRIKDIPFQDMNITFDSSKPEMLQFKTTDKLIKLIDQYGLPTTAGYNKQKVFDVLLSDKKREGEQVNFILLERIGKAISKKLPLREIYKLI